MPKKIAGILNRMREILDFALSTIDSPRPVFPNYLDAVTPRRH